MMWRGAIRRPERAALPPLSQHLPPPRMEGRERERERALMPERAASSLGGCSNGVAYRYVTFRPLCSAVTRRRRSPLQGARPSAAACADGCRRRRALTAPIAPDFTQVARQVTIRLKITVVVSFPKIVFLSYSFNLS